MKILYLNRNYCRQFLLSLFRMVPHPLTININKINKKQKKLNYFINVTICILYVDIGDIMIDNELTIKKFGEIPSKFSIKHIVVKCDLCGCIFEKKSLNIYSARKNSKSDIDVCENISCIKLKREDTMLKKYGVKNAGMSSELREKAQLTCLSKYGVKDAMQSNDVKNKSKDAIVKKYGVDNIFKTENFKRDLKLKNIKKYGVEFYSQTQEYKEKCKQTCIKKYGVEHPMKDKIFLDKSKNTNLKKYGTEYYLSSNDKKEKTKNFYKKNFNVNCYSQTEEARKKSKKRSLLKLYNSLINGERLKKLYKPLFSIEDYEGVGHKYKFQCMKCNQEFLDTLDDGNFPQCLKCNPSKKEKSLMESELKNFLIDDLGLKNLIFNDKVVCDGLELDIYFPDKGVAIEMNGNYFHSELGGLKNKQYHINKTELCESKNIRLIHIFEDEWRLKQNIIINRIKSILKIGKVEKIYARNCIVKTISTKEYREFIENNHLQGFTPAKIKLGLFFKDKLISTMSFGQLRRVTGNINVNNNEYELIRYCSENVVIGGAEKLLNNFIKNYNPKKIISYADRRWSFNLNNLYKKLGFIFCKKTSPNYFYVNKKNYLQRFHRFTFRKSELKNRLNNFDSSLTEWENMQLNGYDRIWDCGNLKYELNL